MPYDPLLVAETKSWFIKAANDLRAAIHEFSAEPPLLGDIVLHCQPTPDGYQDVGFLHRGESIAPQAFPQLVLAVDALLG